MDQSKVRFSWEKKPGLSKLINEEYDGPNQEAEEFEISPVIEIIIPRVSTHEATMNIPLPPCTFQPAPVRSSSRKGFKNYKLLQDDDPFLAAYKECTKSTARKGSAGSRKGFMFKLSCKNSCSVRDDNLVRVSQVPSEIDKEKGQKKWHQ